MRALRSGCVVAALALCIAAPPAAGEPAAAVVENQGIRLWLFDTAKPGDVTGRLITGLQGNEEVRGIDTRPATGQVYIWTVPNGMGAPQAIKTYSLDITTGAATFVGATASTIPGVGDVDSAFDFNPLVDRVRFSNVNDESGRLNPNNAALAGDDTDLTPAATTTVIANAYDRNRVGTPMTSLYVIDAVDSMLGLQGGVDSVPSPNGGAVTELAPLGFVLSPGADGGFDISPSGVGYAALTSTADDLTRLYTIALPREAGATPVATAIGPILDGGTPLAGFTILDDDRDQDGVLTTADKCPAEANATPDGCVAQPAPPPTPPTSPPVTNNTPPTPALSLSVTGVSSRVALASLRKSGLLVTATPNLASSLVVELRGTLKGTRLARTGDIVLAEKSVGRAAGARKVRLKLSRANQRRLRKAAKLRVIVTATDALGRATKVTRNLRIR